MSLLAAGLANRLPIRLSYAKYTATYCGSGYRYRAYLSGPHIAAAHLSMSLREKCSPKSSRFEVAVRNVSISMHKCVLVGHDLLQVLPHNKYCVQSRRRKDAVRSSVGVATTCRQSICWTGEDGSEKGTLGRCSEDEVRMVTKYLCTAHVRRRREVDCLMILVELVTRRDQWTR